MSESGVFDFIFNDMFDSLYGDSDADHARTAELLESLHESGALEALGYGNCTSPISAPGVKLYGKTKQLRVAILAALEHVEKPVTVRQAYYLVASRGDVEKTSGGYGRVQRQILQMRREGVLPYGWIADNTRWRIQPDTYDGLGDFFERSRRFYRQDLWIRSPDYVEIWCEKDSIAGVLSSVTDEYAVPLLPARGYSSETFAYEAAEHMRESGKDCYVYYAGDLDPSGWDASRDLEQRLTGFFPGVVFKRLAVQPEDMASLQTRPTKKSDTRTKRFFREFGRDMPSAELEAMHPDELRRRVRQAIESHVDNGELEALRREEKAARETLDSLAVDLRANGGAV